jgi:hypothetical protein
MPPIRLSGMMQEMEVGETRLVTTFEDGTKLFVTLESAMVNNRLRANTTSTHTFKFTYDTIFGIPVDGYTVNMVCNWDDSAWIIYNLYGSYTVHATNKFSVSWASNEIVTPTYRAEYLNVTFGGSTYQMTFDAAVAQFNPSFIYFGAW